MAIRPAAWILRHLGIIATLLAAVCCSCASAAQWAHHDLGPFCMDAPSAWSLTEGGIDSVAGELTGERVLLGYDFGLYSDPLQIPEGATDVDVRSVTVDGLSGRQVRYTLRRSGEAMHSTGIHVADAGASSKGQLKLTVWAESVDEEQIRVAEAVMATIRFKHKGGKLPDFCSHQ